MKTVKCIVAVLVILFAGFHTSAQTNTSLFGSFGIKAGVNISNLYVDDVTDENTRVGFQLGFFAKAPLTTVFAIQPELIYSQKGATLEYNNAFASGRFTTTLHYIELPVMGVVNLTKNFNLHAGPYISYLAGVNVDNKSSNDNLDFERELNRENFEKFDYGVAAGLGIDMSKLGIGLRYNYGLQEVGKEREILGQPFRISNGKNSVIQLFVTVGL